MSKVQRAEPSRKDKDEALADVARALQKYASELNQKEEPPPVYLLQAIGDLADLVPDDDTPDDAHPKSQPDLRDAPPEYDAELGLIRNWTEPVVTEDSEEQAEAKAAAKAAEEAKAAADGERFACLATEAIGRLGHYSDFRDFMPLAKLPRTKPKVHPSILEALPELEKLHRALFPHWRQVLEEWFRERAMAKLEAKWRPKHEVSFDHQQARLDRGLPPKKPIQRVNAMPEREAMLPRTVRAVYDPAESDGEPGNLGFSFGDLVSSAKHVRRRLRASHRRGTPGAMFPAGVPLAGLTLEILEYLGEKVVLGAGRGGRLEPPAAVKLAEEWASAADPNAAMKAWVKDQQKQKKKAEKKKAQKK